jgi:Zn-dependent metalloprotease
MKKGFIKPLFAAIITLFPLLSKAQEKDTLEIQRDENWKVNFARFKQNDRMKIQDGIIFLSNILQTREDDELRVIKDVTDELGINHRKYQHYFKGIKVEGSEYQLHGKSGFIETIDGNFREINISSVIPLISEQEALKKALSFVNAKIYKWEDSLSEKFIKQNLNNLKATYYPRGEIIITKDNLTENKNLKLAWKFTISSLEPNNEQLIYVDASTNNVINNIPLILDANVPCTAQTRYSNLQNITGDTYAGGIRLREIRNNVAVQTLNLQNSYNYGGAVDFSNNNATWTPGNWPNINQDQWALDAHWGAEKVLDFWRTIFNRNSIDGNGLRILSYVHAGAGWENAGWVGGTSNFMQYGDGGAFFRPLTSLDVCAHEFGHGICQYTSNLTYQGESGALNEGFSDIWGASIENWAAPTKQTWLIGEEITLTQPALRSMSNPNQFGQPDTYLGINWFTVNGCIPTQNNDWCGVHRNSGVLNYWFFLLSQGGNGTNDINNVFLVNGIGIANARSIAYRTESLYLTSTSNYTAARNGSIQAAKDLFGVGSCAEIAVTNAWYAVGVGGQYVQTTNLAINGTTLICNTSDYIITNLQTGSSVAWSIPSGSGSTLQLAQNTPAANQLRITNQKFYSINTTLTAIITIPGACPTSPITLKKTIANDNNTSSSANYTYFQEACLAGNVNYPSQSGTTTGAVFVHSGCYVYVTLGDLTGKTVSFVGSTPPLGWAITNTNINTLLFQLPLGAGGIPFTFKISGAGACYEQQMMFFVYSNNGRPLAPATANGIYTFTAVPNPVKDILTVTAKENKNEDYTLNTKTKLADQKTEFTFNIYDVNKSVLQITQKSKKGSLQHQINTSQLKTGYYILEIIQGNQTAKPIKFFKQ